MNRLKIMAFIAALAVLVVAVGHLTSVMAQTAFHSVKDEAFSTLSLGLSISGTSLTVADAASFPANADCPFWIGVWQEGFQVIEKMEVTAVSGNVLTVVRAQLGSVANIWQAGAYVEQLVFAGNITEIHTAITALETSPPASIPRSFFCFQFSGQQGYPTAANGCSPLNMYLDTTYYWGLPLDKATQENAFWQFMTPLLPATKTVKFYVYGAVAATETNNARLTIKFIDRSDGTVDAQLTNTAVSLTNTTKYFRWDLTSSFSPALTGLESNTLYDVLITRIAADAGDNLNQDLIVTGMTLEVSGDM